MMSVAIVLAGLLAAPSDCEESGAHHAALDDDHGGAVGAGGPVGHGARGRRRSTRDASRRSNTGSSDCCAGALPRRDRHASFR